MLLDKISYNEQLSRKKHLVIFLAVLLSVGITVLLALTQQEEDSLEEGVSPIETLGMPEWEHSLILERPVFPEENEFVENEFKQYIEDPFHITGKVRKNQTLFVALKNHDLDPQDIHPLIASMATVYDFKRSKPGDTYEVFLDADRRIIKFKYAVSPEDIYVAERDGITYLAKKQDIDKVVKTVKLSGTLSTSLYEAFLTLGESGDLASHFMHLFIYDIDFGSDSQEGDAFEVLVDKIYLDGKFYKYGRLWYAHYQMAASTTELNAYYFVQDGDEEGEYYDDKGQSLRKTFLKSPIVGCKLTSPYDLKRKHPIHKRIRPHHGVDWACATGTPIMAIADGIVQFADWKGANGNLLVIDHGNGFTSLSAHLHGFPRGIKKGTHVKQGQIVAYLGNTGVSTGPHLHFGMKKNGVYFDPLLLDRTRMYTLSGQKLVEFKNKIQEYKLFKNEIPVQDTTPSETTPNLEKNLTESFHTANQVNHPLIHSRLETTPENSVMGEESELDLNDFTSH